MRQTCQSLNYDFTHETIYLTSFSKLCSLYFVAISIPLIASLHCLVMVCSFTLGTSMCRGKLIQGGRQHVTTDMVQNHADMLNKLSYHITPTETFYNADEPFTVGQGKLTLLLTRYFVTFLLLGQLMF